jgi:hypothetical protein
MPRLPLEYVPSIRFKLMLLVLACIVPAALLAALLIHYDYGLSYDNFTRSAMATARANAMEVDKELAVVESALVGLSTSPGLTPATCAPSICRRASWARARISSMCCWKTLPASS